MSGSLVVEERTVYALSMPKRIVVRMKGQQTPAVVEADHIEEEGSWIVLRKTENIVAKFKTAEVVSWEIES